MKEFELKYGCNPNQKPARIYMEGGAELPVQILCGRPGYINFLDAFNSWQLVRELRAATGLPCAASFKHVSPTSAALGLPLPEKLKRACFVPFSLRRGRGRTCPSAAPDSGRGSFRCGRRRRRCGRGRQ